VRKLLALVAFLGTAHVCLAEQAAQKLIAVLPDSPKASAGPQSTKIEHLLKAAQHLEAAGLKEDAEKIRRQVDQEKTAVAGQIEALQAEIERLRALTETSQAVVLKVRVFQFSRTKLRELGLRFSEGTYHTQRSTVDALSEYTQQGVVAAPNRFDSAATVLDPKDRFFSALELLGKRDLVKKLSDPTMVTASNQKASFHSGGEFPIPVPQGAGAIGIEWKKYGTILDFHPVVLRNQTIRLECRALFSEIDSAHSTTVTGTTVPGLRSQEMDTSADVRAGRTLVISGLVQTLTEAENVDAPAAAPNEKSDRQRVVRETRNEIETLFLLTPELVSDAAPKRKPESSANSGRLYYLVTEREIRRLPLTGDDTVIDAIATVEGLTQLLSPTVWIARPTPAGFGCEQILPVNYEALVKGGSSATNYKLMPNDRVFVMPAK
jgi:hypothetical protein